MVFQQFNLFPHLTVLDNIVEGAVAAGRLAAEEALAHGRGNCWRGSGWPGASRPIPGSCPAASSSASPSRGRWPCSRS